MTSSSERSGDDQIIHTYCFRKFDMLHSMLALWLLPQDKRPQQAERVLAPGVLTTIAPVIEEGETYSTPAI